MFLNDVIYHSAYVFLKDIRLCQITCDRTVHLRSQASLNQPLPGARLSICSNTSNCSEFQRKAPAFTQELFNYSLINWEN